MINNQIPTTREFYMWLDEKGGRTLEDVLKDKNGLYVVMYSPYQSNNERKVYFKGRETLKVK